MGDWKNNFSTAAGEGSGIFNCALCVHAVGDAEDFAYPRHAATLSHVDLPTGLLASAHSNPCPVIVLVAVYDLFFGNLCRGSSSIQLVEH